MIKHKLSLASLALLMAWGSLHAAEPVASILVLQGSAIALRGTQEVALARGTKVESGDLIRVGDASSVQMRFTDESVIALRANTQFKIEDYKFTEKGEGDRSIFGLLKGGMRTITGLIGKRNPDAYQMRGATATIGIRGTHFTAVSCASDCLNSDGSFAENGLYGSVTDGTIIVRNSAGDTPFTRDQYFHVPSATTPPIPLLTPPGFLRDKLDGMAKRNAGGQGKTAQSTESQAKDNSGSSPSETTSPALSTPPPVQIAGPNNNTYSPASDSPAVVSSVASSNLGGTVLNSTWQTAYVEAWVGHNYQNAWVEGASDHTETFSNVTLPAGVTSYDPVSWYMNAFGPFNTTETYDGFSYASVFTKTASTDTGNASFTDGSKVFWGRYQETDTFVVEGYNYNETNDTHWIVGPPATNLPTSGVFTYNHVGGTRPTDQAGNVGTLVSGGAWTVNFGTSQMYSASPVTWTMPTGTSYSVSVSAGMPLSLAMTSTTYTDTMGGGTSTQISKGISTQYGSYGSCSGNSCALTQVMLSPQFIGNGAPGLGVGIATNASTANGIENTAQARFYKR